MAAATISLKAMLFPWGIGTVLRRLDVQVRVPSAIGVPSAILLAIALCARSFVVLHPVKIGAETGLPLTALPIAPVFGRT